jgi:two-component system sensor histidine kinase/response regulator
MEKSREELIIELQDLKLEFESVSKSLEEERNHYDDVKETLNLESFLLTTLMDNLPDNIYFKDRESRFIRINKNLAKSFGLSDPSQAIGKTDFDFFTKEHAQQAFDDEQTIIRTGQILSIEEKETHPVLPDTWVSTVKVPMRDKEGNIIGTFGVSRDITERKMVETNYDQEQYLMSSLMDNLPDHIYFKDRESRFIRINKSLAKFFDMSDPSLAVGKSDFDFFSKEHAQPAFDDEQNIIRTGEILNLEEKETHDDRPETWVSTIKLPLSDKKGNIVGTFGISRDVTNRKVAEEVIKLKNELLQTINAEKDKFFSIIAHDLRGPMGAFLSATQILTEEIQVMTMEEIKEITEDMKNSAANIYSLLENLLEWSRMQRGITKFQPEKFVLMQKVVDNIKMVNDSAKKKSIKIDYNIPDNLMIFADKHMFDTVIRNLVSNAIKFTHRGGIINVSASITTDNTVDIHIKDSGIGMSADMISKLFKLNENTSRKGTEDEPSTGLGLLLCKEFVEKNGGKISVSSEENKGSTFCFSVPHSA